MFRRSCLALILSLAAGVSSLWAQSPVPVVPISAEQIQAVVKTITAAQGDQQIRVVDLGAINLAVGVLHRAKTTDTPGAPINGLLHSDITETYVIISGGGTLVTGGTIANGRAFPADNEVVTVLAGPSVSGPIQNPTFRVVKTGDVIIIPAGTPHGWTAVADHVDYLSIRPDPKKVLPAGYVNPTIAR